MHLARRLVVDDANLDLFGVLDLDSARAISLMPEDPFGIDVLVLIGVFEHDPCLQGALDIADGDLDGDLDGDAGFGAGPPKSKGEYDLSDCDAAPCGTGFATWYVFLSSTFCSFFAAGRSRWPLCGSSGGSSSMFLLALNFGAGIDPGVGA